MMVLSFIIRNPQKPDNSFSTAFKEVGIDYFIDEVASRKEGLNDDEWRAVLGIAEVLLEKAKKRNDKVVCLALACKPLEHMRFPRGKFAPGEISGWPSARITVEHLSGVQSVFGPAAIVCQDGLEGKATGARITGIFFMNGDMKSLADLSGIVVCDGDVIADSIAWDAIVIARGEVKVKMKKEMLLARRLRGVPATPVILIDHAQDVMGLVKFFDTAQLGLEMSADKEMAKVKGVRAKSRFARAGFAIGDEVTAVGKTKIESREQFRRTVRRLSAQKKKAVFKVKRGGRIVEMAIDFAD